MATRITFVRNPPTAPAASNVERVPGLDKDERYLVLLFLRRYVTYCARRRRYGQMQGRRGCSPPWGKGARQRGNGAK